MAVTTADVVFRWLGRLDVLLRAAVGDESDLGAPGDPFRGLHVGRDEVVRALARQVGVTSGTRPTGKPTELPPTLLFLRDAYGLSDFDCDVLLVALAPEVDLRYQRVYAYLQDDVTRRLPTVDLALNLLCATPAEKLTRRAHFAADRPLLRHGLLGLLDEPGQLRTPLLARQITVDEQIVDALLEVSTVDRRIASWCQLMSPSGSLAALPWVEPTVQAVTAAVMAAAQGVAPLRLYLHGPRGSGRGRWAEALAGQAELPLLVADLAAAPSEEAKFAEALTVLLREAVLFGAALHLRHVDTVDDSRRRRRLLDSLAEPVRLMLLSGCVEWTGESGIPVMVVPFAVPPLPGRRAWWDTTLAAHGLAVEPAVVESLAAAFRLTPGQIGAAVAQVCAVPPPEGIGLDHLRAAARAQTGQRLAKLTRKITPRGGWDDIVLPTDTAAQLRELCARAAARDRVVETWGFGRKLSTGTGTTALFLGPSGTGKTFAAEIVAAQLGLDLYKIDLAGVVSKYIGETEKNLDQIFRAAADANAVLFFDEAEALFGKRSEVRDAHDRYANIEIAYLLQKMEDYEGIAILATNLRHTLDEAFVRRLAFSVHFPFPDETSRRRIWSGIWPSEAPIADDVDLDVLAQQFTLSGGNIKNVALAAAFHAASNGGAVTQAHVLHAVRREFQKLGKELRIGATS